MGNKDNAVVPVSDGQTPEVATLTGSGGVVAEIGWIRFPKSGKQAKAGSAGRQFRTGDLLLVRTDRGDIWARALTSSSRKVFLPADFFEVIEVLSGQDALAALRRDEARGQEARRVFVEQVRKHGLDMHLSEVEITHGDGRIVFNFTAPGRVDFRALVRELAGTLKSRIELRQIGVRDETRCTGGLGPCGLPLCCATFLREFSTVTIRMAKVQGFVPNPQKVSGLCGRLMCCLAYEHGFYTEMMKGLPKNGTTISTPKGDGRVKEVLIMRSVIKVAFGPGEIEEFTFEQLGLKCPGCKKKDCGDKDVTLPENGGTGLEQSGPVPAAKAVKQGKEHKNNSAEAGRGKLTNSERRLRHSRKRPDKGTH